MDNRNVTELYFSDIIKMFKGKGKTMLALILIFAVIGGAFSIAKFYLQKSWTAEAEFYVTTTGSKDELVNMLNSESFVEALLLDSYGIPSKEQCSDDDYKAVSSALEAYLNSKNDILDAKHAYEGYQFNTVLPDGTVTNWALINEEYSRLQSNYDNALSLLTLYKSASTDAVAEDPNHTVITASYEKMLAEAIAEKEAFEKNVYLPAQSEINRLSQETAKKYYQHKFVRRELEEACEKALSGWRSLPETSSRIEAIQKSLTATKILETPEDENGSSKAFFKIRVSVKRDRQLATDIISAVHEKTEFFVERAAEKLTGQSDAVCVLISPYSNPTTVSVFNHVKKAGTSAFLFAFAAFAVYCAFVISRGYIKRAMDEMDE